MAAMDDSKNDAAPPPKDDDPDGMKALSVQEPLNEAALLLRPLEKLRPERTDVWLTVFDVAIRRSKILHPSSKDTR